MKKINFNSSEKSFLKQGGFMTERAIIHNAVFHEKIEIEKAREHPKDLELWMT